MRTALLVDITNGVLAIDSAVEAGKTLMTKATDIPVTLFQALFHDSARLDLNLCNFFDKLICRFFGDQYPAYINFPKDVTACFLAAVCLTDTDTFARYVIDLYADKNDGAAITLNGCRVLLNDIFSNSCASRRIVEDTLQDIAQYASSIADTESVLLRLPPVLDNSAMFDDEEPFPAHIVENFFTRKRKNGLWPLEVFRNQIKMKFLGINFWNQLAKHDLLEDCKVDPSSYSNMSLFVEALRAVVDEVRSSDLKSMVVNEPYGHSDTDSDIILEEGIYISKPKNRRPLKKRNSFPKLKKSLPLSVATELELEDSSEATIERFVRPEEACFHRQRHSPSSSSRSHSPGYSIHSSRTASPQLGDSDMSFSDHGGSCLNAQRQTPSTTQGSTPSVFSFQSVSAIATPSCVNSPATITTKRSNSSSDIPSPQHQSPTSSPGGRGAADNLSTLSATLSVAMSHMRGLKILVVEDSLFQRKMMTKKLSAVSRNASTPDAADKERDGDAGSVSSAESAKINGLTEFDCNNPHCAGPATSLVGVSSEVVPTRCPSGSIEPDQVTAAGTWNITEARNGEEALRLIISLQGGFDVIFVDENLQGTGGYLLGHEVVRILRGHRSLLPSVIIIGCSSNAPKYAHAFLEAGADAVWPKPLPCDTQIMSEICKYLAWRE